MESSGERGRWWKMQWSRRVEAAALIQRQDFRQVSRTDWVRSRDLPAMEEVEFCRGEEDSNPGSSN